MEVRFKTQHRPNRRFLLISSLKKSLEASWMFSRVQESPLVAIALLLVAIKPWASFKNDDAHRDIAFVSLQFFSTRNLAIPFVAPRFHFPSFV